MITKEQEHEADRLARKVAQIFADAKTPFSIMEVALFNARNYVTIGGVVENAPDDVRD